MSFHLPCILQMGKQFIIKTVYKQTEKPLQEVIFLPDPVPFRFGLLKVALTSEGFENCLATVICAVVFHVAVEILKHATLALFFATCDSLERLQRLPVLVAALPPRSSAIFINPEHLGLSYLELLRVLSEIHCSFFLPIFTESMRSRNIKSWGKAIYCVSEVAESLSALILYYRYRYRYCLRTSHQANTS